MIDHTRTEKIGGDSIFMFVVIQVRAENRYDSLTTSLGSKRVRPISSHMLSSMLFRMLDLFVFNFVICLLHFVLSCLNNCDVIYCFTCK